MTQARRKIHPQPLNRRQAIVVIATTLAVGRIGAQALTGKPIVIKVAYPTGGPADVAIRKLQQQLQSGLATPIVIENQPGATGWIAARAVLQTPPDGQTLLVTTGNDLILAPLTLASAIYKPTSFRLVATIAPTDMVLVTSDTHSFANVAALVNASKVGQPLTAGTWGPGSFSHLVTEDFKHSHGREDRRHPLQGCPTDQPSIRSTPACLAVSSWENAPRSSLRFGRAEPGTAMIAAGLVCLGFGALLPQTFGPLQWLLNDWPSHHRKVDNASELDCSCPGLWQVHDRLQRAEVVPGQALDVRLPRQLSPIGRLAQDADDDGALSRETLSHYRLAGRWQVGHLGTGSSKQTTGRPG
jgi:Tripartite tricarboxylate transporter family receptor